MPGQNWSSRSNSLLSPPISEPAAVDEPVGATADPSNAPVVDACSEVALKHKIYEWTCGEAAARSARALPPSLRRRRACTGQREK